jgi:NTP pyrophosphatase (non-canonical NTP hydrolase)
MMSEFNDLQSEAMEIRGEYNRLNQENGHQAWDARAYAMGFVGDVGDLVKLVMAAENFREVKGGGDAREAIKHELGDCLWSVFVIADHYGISLEEAFRGTMAELRERIAGGHE